MNWRLLILFTLALNISSSEKNYVFGWTQLDNPELHVPRGGTSSGPAVDLDQTPNPLWLELQNPELSKFEKDRLAILAMQGEYKVNFDFMETMGFVEGYVPEKPYQSWGTEYVFAVTNEKDFISLQHIMVMFFTQADGTTAGPMVVKHWRQDWQYQDKVISNYIGDNTWQANKQVWNQRKGTWSQAVYQVDDSPRYEGYGEWKHSNTSSTWTSNETNRPLPRREATVRNDYDILIGTNIQTITPQGWVHEQNNSKTRLDGSVIAKEIGLARYQRIENFDWSAGKLYWDNTESFWRDVRNLWTEKLDESKTIKVNPQISNIPLYARMFSLADQFAKDNKDLTKEITTVIDQHIDE